MNTTEREIEELKNELAWRKNRVDRADCVVTQMDKWASEAEERLAKAKAEVRTTRKSLSQWKKEIVLRQSALAAVRERLDGLSSRAEEIAEAHARTICGDFGVGVED